MKRLFVIAAVCLAMLSCIHPAATESHEVAIGDTIPPFSVLRDDGRVVCEKDYSKGNALICFFNTGCPDCVRELDVLQEFYNAYFNVVDILLISREEKAASVAAYWKIYDYSMPYSAQDGREVYSLFSGSGIPKVYVVRDGVVTHIFDDVDFATMDELEDAFAGRLNPLAIN